MSASVEEIPMFNGYCPDCCRSGPLTDSRPEAELWTKWHNKEAHDPNDRGDDA